jgi:hypothetical protein
MNTARDTMRDHLENTRYMQDRHERGQSRVAERLFETELALSNRVRIFAAGVLVVSWGLLLDNESGFDLRLVLAACILAIASLILDFGFLLSRRIALSAALQRGANYYNGIGPFAGLAKVAGFFRALLFFGATGILTTAAVMALWPRVAALELG